MLVRKKVGSDEPQCCQLLLEVHQADGYPRYLPDDVAAFVTSANEVAAWVAEQDGRVVGHVALHQASADPTLAAAQRATGLSPDRLAVVSRLFTSPEVRGTGVGRTLLRHVVTEAQRGGQRAVLDVRKALGAPVALYESEGWQRVESVQLQLAEGQSLDLWVYVSPEVDAG